MERRTVIKNLIVFCGTAWFIPSSLAGCGNPSQTYGLSWISDEEVSKLSDVVETIIPENDTPGAKKLGVHLFVLTMVKDCTSKKQQESFTNGLKELDNVSEKLSGETFLKANVAQRQQVLSGNVANSSPDFKYFLSEVKRLTILGYSTSEYVMTNLVPYELVPGHFYGSVKVGAN